MLQVQVMSEKSAELKIVGDVTTVLEGHVSPNTMQTLDRDKFRFALGSGSFTNETHLGETIFIENSPYVSWAEGEVKTESHDKIETPFLMGLDNNQEAGALINFHPHTPDTLQHFYEQLAKYYPHGFAIVGQSLFAELHTTYLKKPPIYSENINQSSSAYWAKVKPEEHVSVCFFGVVIPDKASQKFPKALLKKAFYHNPSEEKASTLLNHTHGALLKSRWLHLPENLKDFFHPLHNLRVVSIRHVLTQSLILKGSFAIFPIASIYGENA